MFCSYVFSHVPSTARRWRAGSDGDFAGFSSLGLHRPQPTAGLGASHEPKNGDRRAPRAIHPESVTSIRQQPPTARRDAHTQSAR